MITTLTGPKPTLNRQSNATLRVLVVDSDDDDGDAISKALRRTGCRIDTGHCGRDGLQLRKLRNYSAIIMNLVQPDQKALEVVRLLRRDHAHSAILVLTGKHDFPTRVAALELGADDYLARPFSTEALFDRMMTVIHKQRVDAAKTITIADLSIDVGKWLVIRGGRKIDLTRREFELLRYLAMHSGEIVSRSDIREQIYKRGGESNSNIVDVYIRYLRKKIESSGKPKLLHTIHGRGYMLGSRASTVRENTAADANVG